MTDRPPPVSDGVVYADGPDRTLLALDAATGDERWTLETASEDPGFSVAVRQGTVYAACSSELVALDRSDGAVRWRRSAQTLSATADGADPDASLDEVLVTDDRLYAELGEGLASLSLTDASVEWYRPFPGGASGDVVLSGSPVGTAVTETTVLAFTAATDVVALGR